MRLWSISFSYLDPIGLVALWREALLAKAVLEGKTVGYKNHPQLLRFKELNDPLEGINTYLHYVLEEGRARGYSFNPSKVDYAKVNLGLKIPVKEGQLVYELGLLRFKLRKRNLLRYEMLREILKPKPNPLFYTIEGGIEPWERVKHLGDL
ncbi:MAG TPA: pyrimidine dimer DNA glycosylase/endonuclease V [Geobacterales bacterium]|nr:pyrimidine dimer DNA glycosylase/endonuclease V [Geobacterales bacterium]